MRRPRFDRGDIVLVNLNPTAGREQQGVRPALILTPAAFNATGTAIVAPISQGGNFARDAGFAVALSGCGTATQGVVLSNHIRSIDLEGRNAKLIESSPDTLVDEVLARIEAIFEL